jgi:hypothetical protein
MVGLDYKAACAAQGIVEPLFAIWAKASIDIDSMQCHRVYARFLKAHYRTFATLNLNICSNAATKIGGA